MLKLKNIFKDYKNSRVLKDVNLTFGDESFNVLLGKSGSGKTTLLNIICGLDDSTSGTIIYDGTEINSKNMDAYRNTVVGIVFQELNLIEDFTIKQNLKLSFELAKKKITNESLTSILAKVSLPDDGDTLEELLIKKPNQLSVGQKQRIAIARALIKEPQILLLDEPTSALDDENAKSIVLLLKELSKNYTVIVSTHAKNIFDDVADQIVELKEQTAIILKSNAKLKDFSKKDRKFKKGFLPFFETLAFSIRNLKHKKVRLLTSLVISLISATLFGAAYLINTCDTNSVLLKTQLDNNMKISSIEKYLTYYNHSSEFALTRRQEFNDEEEEKINEYTSGGYVKLNNSNIRFSLLDSDGEVIDSLLNNYFINLFKAKIDQETASYFGFVSYDGLSSKTSRLPENDNEIVISRLLAETLVSNYFGVSYDSIVNETVYDVYIVDDLIGMDFYGYTIVGIYAMEDDMFDFWKPYVSLSYEQAINDSSLDYEYLENMNDGFSISQCIFRYSETESNSSRYLIKFTGNYSNDLNFINSFTTNDNYINIVNQYYGLTVIINTLSDPTIMIVVWSIIAVFLVISLLISINLFFANVKSMEKNLGILKAIGSSKEEISFIIGLQALFISLIEFILTIIFLLISAYIFNKWSQISLLSLNISLVLYLLLILIIFALIVSLLASRKALLDRPINVIENK